MKVAHLPVMADSVRIGGVEINAPPGGAIPILIIIFLSLLWIVFDAQRRGKSGCLALFLGIFIWPFSLLIWLWLRPPLVAKSLPSPPPSPIDR